MGSETALSRTDLRWLTPLPLWTGIVAGPLAWAFDLTASYAVVHWVCHTRNYVILPAISIASLAVVVAATGVSWAALVQTSGDVPTDGGRPRQRARFMAVLGLASCALFALQILAAMIPRWMLDACQ